MATRQREWQKKQVAAGRCPLCGGKRGENQLCEPCREKQSERCRVAYQKRRKLILDSVASDR